MDAEAYSFDAIEKGSKSFYFASLLFAPRMRRRVVQLYAWCRFVDNEIDDSLASVEEKRMRLGRLRHDSFVAPSLSPMPMAIKAFHDLCAEVRIPQKAAEDLLDGMQMDLDELHYETEETLDLYCYRVAGVVGLMMNAIMEANSPGAEKHAVDLGKAMQLTNICRDIGEDAAMGRVYLPRVLLEARGLSPETMLGNREELSLLVASLLRRADELYRSGDQGLVYLPLRCAFAVSVAREVYAEIGVRIRARGARAWDERVYVPLLKKMFLVLRAARKVLATIPPRLLRKRRNHDHG